MEIEKLVEVYPTLYHMAEANSWENIVEHGLLSTNSLMELYDTPNRAGIVRSHRPESITISKAGLPDATIRDQKPMSDSALRKVLDDDLLPADWYEILNSKVFFWSSWDKVLELLNASAYRDREHDVIEVDTKQNDSSIYTSREFLCAHTIVETRGGNPLEEEKTFSTQSRHLILNIGKENEVSSPQLRSCAWKAEYRI